jgi:hypothetical protein
MYRRAPIIRKRWYASTRPAKQLHARLRGQPPLRYFLGRRAAKKIARCLAISIAMASGR